MTSIDTEDKQLGVLLRRHLRDAELTQPEFAKRLGYSQGWVSGSLFGRPAETLRYLWAKKRPVFERIVEMLELDRDEVLRIIGLLPGQSSATVRLDSEQRRLPSYTVNLPRLGEGTLVTNRDESIPIETGRGNDLAIYHVTGEGIDATYIVRRQAHGELGKLIVCTLPERGTIVARLVNEHSGVYYLQTLYGEAMTATKIDIHGVVIERRESYE